MKNRLNFRLLLYPIILVALVITSTKCTHEDEVLGTIVPADYEYGTDVVKESEGYAFDKTHSSVTWETPYYGVGSSLTGRFNSFDMTMEFEENNPANIVLTGYVDLTTVNTGEPGRDQGCLQGTLGTSVGGTEQATFASTSVEFDGQGGYNVVGDFSFHGFDGTVEGKLTYSGITLFDPGTPVGGTDGKLVAGFTMEFDILAKTDYGIVSNSVADKIHIVCSANFKKTP